MLLNYYPFYIEVVDIRFHPSVSDDNAHGAASAGDHGDGGVDVGAVEVGHLLLGDLANVFLGDGSDLVSLGNTGSGVNAAGLLDQEGGRRSLANEGEATVGVHGDNDRDHETHIALGALIEILCELPDIDAVLAECRAYRGSRGCLTGRNLESDVSYNFLCQFSAPLSFNL